MSHSDYRSLLDKGRKAGLSTSELYQALSSAQPDQNCPANGQADINGFVSGTTKRGSFEYRPAGKPPEDAA